MEGDETVIAERFADAHEAATFVREVGIPTGEYDLLQTGHDLTYRETFRIAGVPVSIAWTIPEEYLDRELEDWPWDNGSDRVVPDGVHVTRVDSDSPVVVLRI